MLHVYSFFPFLSTYFLVLFSCYIPQLAPWFSFVFQFVTSLVAQMVKRLPTMWETQVWSLGLEDPLEKEMAAHSNTLAWKIPWMEDHGRIQSMWSQRVGHDWVTSLHFVLQLVLFLTGRYFVGFLCLPGQSVVLYFCWTILILLMSVYVYVYIQSHFLLLL